MSPEHHDPSGAEHACDACALPPSRREFIRDLTLAVAGALTTLGISRKAAAELPVSAITALASEPAAKQYALPSADGVQIDRASEVILVRWQGSVYAFNLSCPHQNTALRWNDKDHRFKCPKHNSRYEPDGTFVDGRATRGMDRFAVTLSGTNVVVDINTLFKQDENAAGWNAAVVHVVALAHVNGGTR